MNMPNWLPRRTEPEFDPRPIPVDFDAIAQHLRAGQQLADYAPKRQHLSDIDHAVEAVKSFSALPTKQIDDAIDGLKEELTKLEIMAQNLRNAYVEASSRLLRYIERQKAVHAITATAFGAMRQQCAALDQPELPFESPAEPPKAEEPPEAA